LLPEKKSLAPKKLRTDLGVFFRRAPTADDVAQTVTALRAEGFIAPKGQRATDAGRARALQFLGIEKLPPRANWTTVKAKYLVPRALGLPLDSAEYAKASTGKKPGELLAALLLKRKLDLPNAGHTLTAVLDAFICRSLGEAIGGEPISKKEAQTHFPRVLLNVPSASKNELFAAILSGAFSSGHTEPEPEPEPAVIDEPFDLEMFANTVKSAARTCPTGRFGGYKVFINHVWNQLRDEPRFSPLGLDGFKAKLVEANRANLLTLSRADLVQLMDPADVRESETTYLTATFHFILIEGN
jgi:hypothetical protein